MTQPTVTEWGDKKGFAVTWHNNAYDNSISYANLPTLHAILTEKLAEMNARKWVPAKHEWNDAAWGCYRQSELDDGFKAVFYGAEAERRARAYADQQNAEEGLS